MMTWLMERGLTLTLLAFLLMLAGQIVAGRADYNEERADHGAPEVTFVELFAVRSHVGGDVRELGKRVPADRRPS